MPAADAFGGHNLAFVEDLYVAYLRDPSSVDAEWHAVFEPLRREQAAGPLRPSHTPRGLFDPAPPRSNGDDWATPAQDGFEAAAASLSGIELVNELDEQLELQDRLDQLATSFRTNGHLEARLDPLDRPRPSRPELNPAFHLIKDADLDSICSTVTLGVGAMNVGQVIRRLRNTYCRYIGVEFMHLRDADARRWLQQQMEATENRLQLGYEEQVNLLSKLIDAEVFEQFIRRKYLGAKSFSLEGGESLIPLLHLAIEKAAAKGVEEIVVGMAHRGRLSVLANVMRKHPREIFREFDDKEAEHAPEKFWGRGDVKYHLGFRCVHTAAGGQQIRLRLAFNPSHLEFVGPVVLGQVRARQDRMGDGQRTKVMPFILHGDAAFAGQGIVPEMLNLSGLPGYRTGGSLHVIVNNQIGFTTPPESSRTPGYASDVAKMLQAPIFHVNGEHPESVAQVVSLAMDYRERFRSDVFIDMYCYRRHGHNEGDEPAFTQPVMYKAIRSRPTVRESYLQQLVKPDGLTEEDAAAIIEQRTAYLDSELSKAREDLQRMAEGEQPPQPRAKGWPWAGIQGGADADVAKADTGYDAAALSDLLRKTTVAPSGFNVLPKLSRIFEQRLKMADGERPLDWAAGEALAFATLLVEGHPVRISGQDCGRGTFSHRHAVMHDESDESEWVPLEHLAPGQARFEVYDSPLTEAAVLGFDYGYSLDRPDALTIWEAQFGDFCNGAQVIIDQFITSAEDKWDLLSGLVMLLPHGFEGQGPEHSSARLERFLQMCAEDNIQVVNLTTPAQIFHCLRRQVVRPYRKPLVVMSPKSLLRLPQATSSLEELATGSFQRVIPDQSAEHPVRRILLCSGRVYYDLTAYRADREKNDIDIVRVEQLYPFPEEELKQALAPYLDGGERAAEGIEAVWVQEEPRNMGAWYYLRALECLGESLWNQIPFRCVSRDESASPATGSAYSHKREQEMLIARAFWS